MQLLTKPQLEQLLHNGQPEHCDSDQYPVVKLFLPGTGCTWLLTQIDPENHDIAVGLCDLGLGFPELGSVSLAELAAVKSRLRLPVECDRSFTAHYPISVYARAACRHRQIVEQEDLLAAAVK